MPKINDADNIYRGTSAVDKVYLGATQVWPGASTVQFVAVSGLVFATGSPLTLSVPAGVAEGDLLVSVISRNANNLLPAAPSGWTLHSQFLTGSSGSSGGARLGVYHRFAPPSPPASYAFPFDNVYAGGLMLAFRDVDLASPFGVETLDFLWTNTAAGSPITQQVDPVNVEVEGAASLLISFANHAGNCVWLEPDDDYALRFAKSDAVSKNIPSWSLSTREGRVVGDTAPVNVSMNRDLSQAGREHRSVRLTINPSQVT